MAHPYSTHFVVLLVSLAACTTAGTDAESIVASDVAPRDGDVGFDVGFDAPASPDDLGVLDAVGGECHRDCTAKTCGSDGCGGSCGACAATEACDGVGKCLAAPAAAGPGTNASTGYTGAKDEYADEIDMRFRLGLSTFDTTALTVVPTFHSAGLYWPRLTTVPAGAEVKVQFREIGRPEWRPAQPLWFDARNDEYRGSVVDLVPGTRYEFQVQASSGTSAAALGATWPESFPIARTITLPAGTTAKTLIVDQSGTPSGYVLYVAAPSGSTIDQGFAQTGTQDCVDVRASYVIVRGLTLKNCQDSGISVLGGSHDVVLEGNDISGFGAGPGGAIEGPTSKIVPGNWETGGVTCPGYKLPTAQKPSRIVVQRNVIHDPRYGSIHWGYAHPNSADAVFMNHCGPNNVYRYNEVRSSAGHYFQDGIGGADNFTFEGFPGADSDVYGNVISDVYDDGIESEGGNRNVRIWGNYIHHTYATIALATTSVGPFYAFRNVSSECTGLGAPTAAPDSDDRGPFFKMGSPDERVNGGRIYFFHNTTIQPTPPAGVKAAYSFGTGAGIEHSGGNAVDVVSRNNIFSSYKDWHAAIVIDAGDVDYDLHSGTIVPSGEARGLVGLPVFASDVDPRVVVQTYPDVGGTYKALTAYLATKDPWIAGMFSLAATSKGYRSALPLANFNDAYATPDMGAHQSGSPKMEFGVKAYAP